MSLPRLLFILAGLIAPAAWADAVPVARQAETFPLERVRLLDGLFRHAQELNRRYLLAHDIDRLLAPFRLEAGLPSPKPKYPNWESSGLDGHTAGHYLTALAQEVATGGGAEFKRRLDAMVAGLAECQQAGKDGYVGGIPRGRTLWNDIQAGRINFQNFSLNGAWVPWYNEHKLFAGLRDAWLIGGNAQARDVLVRLAGWCDALLAPLTDEQMQAMLGTEHGGMNEVLADVYAITGDAKYLRLAQRFSHRAILDPLMKREDKLTGLHANTQIPKVVGFARIAELGGDPTWRDAARFFWETVVGHRSVAFGGNSEREHFNPVDDFSALLESREGPETCNTYNMLRLSEALFRTEPDGRYADYHERALYNHILASQHPEHGGYVYFTPIRPRHYRVYSQPGTCFWCCVGTGMENHGKYGGFIYARSPANDALFVNLFIASELDWKERGVRVRQETEFPGQAGTTLVVSTETPQRFALRIRHPGWSGRVGVVINGTPQAIPMGAAYLTLDREWRDGDRVEVSFAMHTTLARLPDNSDYAAVMHGPIVLAAKTGTESLDGLVAGDGRMAHISPGPYLPLDRAPMLVGDPAEMANAVRRIEGKPLTFTAAELIQPGAFRQLELVPFFRVHDSRYMMYWRVASPDKYAEVVRALEASERERLALEGRTLDQVAPGEQQSEVEHGFAGEATRAGALHGRRSREAAGWFSYQLNGAKAGLATAGLELIVTYDSGERGRKFDILVNDRAIATVELVGGRRDRFVDVAYAIPAELATAGTLTVKFAAKEKSRTGSVFGVRLARVE